MRGLVISPRKKPPLERLEEQSVDAAFGTSSLDPGKLDRAVHGRAVQDRAVQDRAVQDRTVQDRAVQDRAVQDRAVQGRAVQDRTVQDRAVQDRAVQDRTVQDRTVQDRTVQDRAVHDRAVQDRAVQGRAKLAAGGAAGGTIGSETDTVTDGVEGAAGGATGGVSGVGEGAAGGAASGQGGTLVQPPTPLQTLTSVQKVKPSVELTSASSYSVAAYSTAASPAASPPEVALRTLESQTQGQGVVDQVASASQLVGPSGSSGASVAGGAPDGHEDGGRLHDESVPVAQIPEAISEARALSLGSVGTLGPQGVAESMAPVAEQIVAAQVEAPLPATLPVGGAPVPAGSENLAMAATGAEGGAATKEIDKAPELDHAIHETASRTFSLLRLFGYGKTASEQSPAAARKSNKAPELDHAIHETASSTFSLLRLFGYGK